MLPNFLVIGGMKCGTTSLDHYLKAHPQISMPEKEVDFFSRNFDFGLDWYESLFEKKNDRIKVFGETSVSYTKYPLHKGVPERISSSFPNVKLIYVVRDPIQRIISHYMHNVYADAEDRSLENILKDEGHESLYVYFSLYYLQIEKYLEYFSENQFMIICSEDLRENNKRKTILKEIFRFLDVDATVQSTKFNEVKYETTKKGKKKGIAKWVSTLPFYETFVDISPTFLRAFYIRLFTEKLKPPILSDSLRDKLVNIIAPDTEKLRRFTGDDFASWSL